MATERDDDARELLAYAATALGGFVGGVTAGVSTWVASSAYYTRQIVGRLERGDTSESFDELAAAISLTVLAGLLGAGLGAGGILRLLRYSRPALSGLLFVVLVVAFVPLLSGIGAVLLPVNVGISAGAVLVAVISSALAGVVARGVVHELEVRKRASPHRAAPGESATGQEQPSGP